VTGWLVAAGAALVAFLAGLLGRRNPWKKRAETTLQRAEEAGQASIQERARVAAQEVLDDLQEARDRPGDERLDGALARARRRRAGQPPGDGGAG